MADYACLECLHAYDSADHRLRCRVDGLLTSPAHAEMCKRFVSSLPEDSDDDPLPIDYCDWIGRGD